MRATNLMIGGTTLAVIAAALVGVLAFQKIRIAHQRSPLRIVFNGSASGLRRGGGVIFDGVPAGEIRSITLESPRKIVALVTLDNTAPIRNDTEVGIQFQGLTGIAEISLVGGAPSAPPVPLDKDGIPVLTADWSEQQSVTDTLHNVDHLLVDNEATIKDALLSFAFGGTELRAVTEDGAATSGVLLGDINDEGGWHAFEGCAVENFKGAKRFAVERQLFQSGEEAAFVAEGGGVVVVGMARFPVGNDDRAWAKLADFFGEAKFMLAACLNIGVGNAKHAAVTEAHQFRSLRGLFRARFDGSARAHLPGS